jgi:predicted GNAT superfamily acetyltransferase
MPDSAPEIGQATKDDIADVLALQDANQPDRGGMLSARLPRESFEAALLDMPLIVARREGRIVGYLMSFSMGTPTASIPITRAMLKAYPAGQDAYIYGPICVAEDERGKGVASALFRALCARVADRECVTFIRADNAASLHAHAKMGMRTVAEFTHDAVDLVVLAYKG